MAIEALVEIDGGGEARDEGVDGFTEAAAPGLIGLVGADKFKEFFAVEQTIVPTATFTEEKYRKLSKEQRMALADTVKQYKPSIRAK